MSEPAQGPAWAREMSEILRAGAPSQFILHGNVFDLVPGAGKRHAEWVSLPRFVAEHMLGDFDVVLQYDRSTGIRVARGSDHFHRFLKGHGRLSRHLARRGVRPAADEPAEEAIAEFRPSAHVERLQLMDLLAVKECTDARFLPKRFRSLSLPELNERINRFKAAVGD